MLKIMRLLFTVLAGLAFATTSSSADIRLSEPYKLVVIEGKIVEGDYERFVNTVLDGGFLYHKVMLASKGGDAFEAIKIGKLIRALNYETEVPSTTPIGNFCYPIIKPENCTCLSACPLIYISGVNRSGDVLGVHRIYLDQETTKKLSLDESRKISGILSEATRVYLEEMGAPISLNEKVGTLASDKIEMLKPSYVEESLTGYADGYDEWFIARCGSRHQAWEKFDEKKDDATLSKTMGIIKCQSNELENEARKKFWLVMSSAVEAANPSHIPFGSNLAFLKKMMPFEMGDIIGKKNIDAMKMLILSGIGARAEHKVANWKDAGYTFSNMITVSFDVKGRVYRIEFFTISLDDLRSYTGYYLNGLTANSTPENFIKVYGEPIYSGCTASVGTCRLAFEAQNYSVQAIFGPDRKSLRSIVFQVSGYWKNLMQQNVK